MATGCCRSPDHSWYRNKLRRRRLLLPQLQFDRDAVALMLPSHALPRHRLLKVPLSRQIAIGKSVETAPALLDGGKPARQQSTKAAMPRLALAMCNNRSLLVFAGRARVQTTAAVVAGGNCIPNQLRFHHP